MINKWLLLAVSTLLSSSAFAGDVENHFIELEFTLRLDDISWARH